MGAILLLRQWRERTSGPAITGLPGLVPSLHQNRSSYELNQRGLLGEKGSFTGWKVIGPVLPVIGRLRGRTGCGAGGDAFSAERPHVLYRGHPHTPAVARGRSIHRSRIGLARQATGGGWKISLGGEWRRSHTGRCSARRHQSLSSGLSGPWPSSG